MDMKRGGGEESLYPSSKNTKQRNGGGLTEMPSPGPIYLVIVEKISAEGWRERMGRILYQAARKKAQKTVL